MEIEQQIDPLPRRADRLGIYNRNNTGEQTLDQIETSTLENPLFVRNRKFEIDIASYGTNKSNIVPRVSLRTG